MFTYAPDPLAWSIIERMNVLKNLLRNIDLSPVTGSQPPTPPGSVGPAGTEQSLERLTEQARRHATDRTP